MVFTESQLATTNSYSFLNEADNILSEAFMLDPYVSALSPLAIPVVENASINKPVVHYNDIVRLAEENIIAYDEAMFIVAEANGIDPDNLVVSVPDYEITANPSIVDEMYNIAVIPTTSDDIVYTYMEACMDCFLETGDEDFLYSMADDRIITEAKTVFIPNDPKDPSKGGTYKQVDGLSDDEWRKKQAATTQKRTAENDAILGRQRVVKKDANGNDVVTNQYVKDKHGNTIINKSSNSVINNPGELFAVLGGDKKRYSSDNIAKTPGTYKLLAGVLKQTKFGQKPYTIGNDTYMLTPEAAKQLNELLKKAVDKNKGRIPSTSKGVKVSDEEKKRRRDKVEADRAARLAASGGGEETGGDEEIGGGETPASTAEVQKKLTMFQNIKNTLINKPRTFLARKLQWLRNWAEQHLSNLPTENRTIWQKIKAKVYEIINWITNKLGTTKDGRVEDIDYTYNKDYDA